VRRCKVLGTMVFLSLSSCDRPREDGALVTVTDSAGVRIVVNTSTAGVESGWRLASEPVFRVGWEEGDPMFQFLMDGFVRDDGSVVVADATTNTIYVFGPGGDLTYELGGPGEGPGEFEQLGGVIGGRADTVIAQDGFNGGLSVFAGRALVVDRRVGWAWRTGRSFVQLEGRTDEGELLFVPGAWGGGVSDPPTWNQAPVLRLSPDLESVDTIVLADHFQSVPRQQQRNTVRYLGFTTITGDRIVHGRNDRSEVLWWDTAGRLVQIARWDHEFREASEEDWRTFEESYRSQLAGEIAAQPERFNEIMADMKGSFGGTVPAFQYAVTDPAGNVWLADHSFTLQPPTRYSVIASSGEWLGRIEVPTGARWLATTDSYFLCVEQNEWDVQAVVLYEIIKGD